jgi:hypothetical protein
MNKETDLPFIIFLVVVAGSVIGAIVATALSK